MPAPVKEMNEMSLGKEERGEKEKPRRKYKSKRSLRNNFSSAAAASPTPGTKTREEEEKDKAEPLAFVFGAQEKDEEKKMEEEKMRAASRWSSGFSGNGNGGGFVASAAAVAAAAFQMPATFLFASSSNAANEATAAAAAATTMKATTETDGAKAVPEATTRTAPVPRTTEFGTVQEMTRHARPVQTVIGGETSSETSRMDVDDDIVTRTEDLHIGEEVTSVARPVPTRNVVENASTSGRDNNINSGNNIGSAAGLSFSFGAQALNTMPASGGMASAPPPFTSGADPSFSSFARPTNVETTKATNATMPETATRHRGASTPAGFIFTSIKSESAAPMRTAKDFTAWNENTRCDSFINSHMPRTADDAGTSAPNANTIRFNFEASSGIDTKPTPGARSGRTHRRRDVASVIRQTEAMKIDSNGFGSIASPGQPPHEFSKKSTTTAPASHEDVNIGTAGAGTSDTQATIPPFLFKSPPHDASPSPPKPRARSASGRARGRKYGDGLFSGVNAGGSFSFSFQWGAETETFDNVDADNAKATTQDAGIKPTFIVNGMSGSSDERREGVDNMSDDNRTSNRATAEGRSTHEDGRAAVAADERVDAGDSGAFADDEGRAETRRFVRARSFVRGKASASPPTSSGRVRASSMPTSANGSREDDASSSSSISLNKVYSDVLKARMLLQKEKLEEASTAFSEILLSLSAASGGGHESHFIQNIRSQCSDGLQSIAKLTRARKLSEQQQRQTKEAVGSGTAAGGGVQQHDQEEDEHYVKAMRHKNAGNEAYKKKEYERAEREYSAGIAALLERLGGEADANVGNATVSSATTTTAPAARRGQSTTAGENSVLAFMKMLLAILYSNRSACYCHTNAYCRAISDCYSCILYDKHYVKGLWRRVLLFQAIGCEQDQAMTDVQSIVSILKKRLRFESTTRAGGRTAHGQTTGGTGAAANGSGSSIPEMKQEIAKAERLLSTLRNQTWSICHYKVLGLKQFEEDSKKIKTAYRQLALVYHPDKMSQQDQEEVSTSLFKMINEAHNVLSSRKDKLEYDKERRRQQYAPRDVQRDYDNRHSSGSYSHHYRTYYDYSDDSSFDYDVMYGYAYGSSSARYGSDRYRQSNRATSSSTAGSSGRRNSAYAGRSYRYY